MVLHVALFRPRAELPAADRVGLVEALEDALRQIPSIRTFRVGRRVIHGAGYEALMPLDLEYGAVLEFDDLAGLQAYLHHPAHQALGSLFMKSIDTSAIYDYEVQDEAALGRLARQG
jgi:hypothetical protein